MMFVSACATASIRVTPEDTATPNSKHLSFGNLIELPLSKACALREFGSISATNRERERVAPPRRDKTPHGSDHSRVELLIDSNRRTSCPSDRSRWASQS